MPQAKTAAKKGAAKSRTSSRTTKSGTKKPSTSKKKASGKRELITPKGDARFVRRSSTGKFKESDDVGRSQKADRKKTAKTKVKSGYGDRGDQKRSTAAKKK